MCKMIPPCARYFLFFVAILASVGETSKVEGQVGVTTRISLANFSDKNINGQAFNVRAGLPPNSDSFIELYDVPKLVSFVILQIHSHERNLTLSYGDNPKCAEANCSLHGSNLGLWLPLGGNSSAKVAVSNSENVMLDVLVAAVAYTDKAPTPGGCNMEFDMEVSPFQKLHITDATVILEAQPASASGNPMSSCESNPIRLTLYRMYLPERDYKSETYFDGITKMMTVDNIMKNGKQILLAVDGSSVRRIFSAYPGTGSVYAMIATHGNFSAAYVPAATYACRPLTSPSSCGDLNTTIARALCAIVLIIGFIVAFIGHRCLGFEVVFLGAICGGIITFGILISFGYFQMSTILGIVMGVSILSGISWLVLSFCMQKSCIATFLSSMTLGFFVASTIYFSIADDTPLFESNVNFWLIYTGVTLLVPIVLAVLPFSSNIVCCAILGAYSIILPIDYYAGSNLKYIVVNTLRRATVPGFNLAVIQPPYQSTDKCLVALLIIMVLLGIYVQVGNPFRCLCTKRSTTVFWDDTEPILSEPRRRRRVLVFGENEVVQSNW